MKTKYQYEVILRIRKIRERLGISQSKLANILGISDGQVGNIETPTKPHKYTLAQIEILCKEFNVPITSIFWCDKENKDNISIKQLVHKIVLYQETNKN